MKQFYIKINKSIQRNARTTTEIKISYLAISKSARKVISR